MSPQHSSRTSRHRKGSGFRFYVVLMAAMVAFICIMAVVDGAVHGSN